MKIESIHIKGFKSIKDLKIGGLSDINVFFGQNNVGKSNIFQAMYLWYAVLTSLNKTNLHTKVPHPFFTLGSDNQVFIRVIFNYQSSGVVGIFPDEVPGETIQVIADVENKFDGFKWSAKAKFSGKEYEIDQGPLKMMLPSLHLIEANRRIHIERMAKQNGLEIIDHQNLKQALFDAYNSLDFQQKKRLAAIRDILNSPPFELGELDIARDPNNNEINIGFIRPNGRLPIENMGSGTQQLLLMLGQIFLNDYPVIALEEPEMNLSPQYQSLLLETLRQLMKDPAVKLNQLFISTHSPHLEFQENFFHVFLDEEGYTQVERATKVQHAQHFAITPTGPDTGARLNSLNQVKLYQGLIDDLGLKWGDAVYFLRNEAGRWEIRPENEVVAEVKEVLEK